MQLQKQQYPTLSISKIIEKILLNFYKGKLSSTNENEKFIAKAINDSIEKYLQTKVSASQKKAVDVN